MRQTDVRGRRARHIRIAASGPATIDLGHSYRATPHATALSQTSIHFANANRVQVHECAWMLGGTGFGSGVDPILQ